ncbi:MAG: HAMP domain-containing sensor histidine kinase [Polyangiaceae bacterium]
MSLRSILTACIVAVATLAIAASASLVLLTTYLHQTATGFQGAIESLRLAEEMEVALLTHNRTTDSLERAQLEQDLERMTTEAGRYIDSDDEHTQLALVKESLDGYQLEGTSPAFDTAFGSIRELVAVSVEQSRALEVATAGWDDIARLLGTSLAVALLLGTALILFWLRAQAFRPAIALGEVIGRYGRGAKTLRAAETGPTEFAVIGHRFNEMASEIAQQNENQLNFLAGVAHDLRNPLTALKMSGALISPETPLPSEERVRQLFTRMQRQVDRLDRMVGDFLDASRIEAGILELRLEPCDLREPALTVVELLEPTAPRHEIVLNLPSEAVVAQVDPTRIEQVLTNLVSNAIKYSPRGGRIEVTVACDVEASVTVTDHGVGLSAEDREHLFKPFQRRGPARESIEGVGLGLFVARRIVDAHGGRIVVESIIGRGSTFRVRLPMSRIENRGIEGRPEQGDSERVH